MFSVSIFLVCVSVAFCLKILEAMQSVTSNSWLPVKGPQLIVIE